MSVKAVISIAQIREMISKAQLNVEASKSGGGSIELYATTENEMAECAAMLISNRIDCTVDCINKRCASVFTRSFLEAN